MDTGAELTLQIGRLVQSHACGDVAPTPDAWLFWPRGDRLDWEGARGLLSRLTKPLLIAPLLEPGMLGLWTLDTIDEAHRQVVGQEISNQVQYYADKLTALSTQSAVVRFGSGTAAYQMTRDEFLHWAAEYAINVGISLAASSDPGVAVVTVRPTGGGRPPLVV